MTTQNFDEVQFMQDLMDHGSFEADEWNDLVNSDLPEVLPQDYVHQGEVINRPSEEAPAPMKVSDLAFKGYVPVWDTVTGVESLQPKYLLWQTMEKRREDGSKVFTLTNPHIPPRYGDDLKCVLHPESPLYSKLMGMGFQSCIKRHIPNQAALNAHLSKSHKATWAYLEQDRLDRIREEDRQLQRDAIAANQRMLEAMTQAAVRGVSAPVTETITVGPQDRDTSQIVVPSRRNLFDSSCPDCGRTFHGSTGKQAKQRMGLHQRQCKAKKS